MGGYAGRRQRADVVTDSDPGREYYLGQHVLLCGDAADVFDYAVRDHVLIYDPPWDIEPIAEVIELAARHAIIAFADGQTIGEVFDLFGAPTWVFAWDTAAPWSQGPRRPLKQTKLAAWYGNLAEYQRDATPIGTAAPSKNHPGTSFEPGSGRRLSDLWRQSLRWHHAGAPHPHMKPLGWVRALLGNATHGPVLDPFAGSGQAMFAADQLDRPSFSIEADPYYCDVIRARWTAYCTSLGRDPGTDALPVDLFPDVALGVSDQGGHVASLKRRAIDQGASLFEIGDPA